MQPPGWMAAKLAVKGIWAAFIVATLLAFAIFAAVQTARLEGLRIWPLSLTGWIEAAQDRQATIDRMVAAQIAAAEQARLARLAQESKYRDIAERIDEHAQDDLDSAMRAADRFIAAGGMRAEGAGSSPCNAGAAARDRSAGDTGRTGRTSQLDAEANRLADGTGGVAEGFVIVSAEDIRICTRNTIKAEAGHQLATQLQDASAPDKAAQ